MDELENNLRRIRQAVDARITRDSNPSKLTSPGAVGIGREVLETGNYPGANSDAGISRPPKRVEIPSDDTIDRDREFDRGADRGNGLADNNENQGDAAADALKAIKPEPADVGDEVIYLPDDSAVESGTHLSDEATGGTAPSENSVASDEHADLNVEATRLENSDHKAIDVHKAEADREVSAEEGFDATVAPGPSSSNTTNSEGASENEVSNRELVVVKPSIWARLKQWVGIK